MNIEQLSNGDLKMTADVIEQEAIRKMLARPNANPTGLESEFISNFLGGDPMGNGISYEQVSPESCRALTLAPLISDGDNIFGYMDYQAKNFLELLAVGKSVIWRWGRDWGFCFAGVV